MVLQFSDLSLGLVKGKDLVYLPSPNFSDRSESAVIDLLVIHCISLPPSHFGGEAVSQLFQNNFEAVAKIDPALVGLKVSAHFFIRRTGQIIQFVPCIKRAWHAGHSFFQGRHDCNDTSIGIELEGDIFSSFELVQYQKLIELVHLCQSLYPLDFVAGHSDIAPRRKKDPGPFFNWPLFLSHVSLIKPI